MRGGIQLLNYFTARMQWIVHAVMSYRYANLSLSFIQIFLTRFKSIFICVIHDILQININLNRVLLKLTVTGISSFGSLPPINVASLPSRSVRSIDRQR